MVFSPWSVGRATELNRTGAAGDGKSVPIKTTTASPRIPGLGLVDIPVSRSARAACRFAPEVGLILASRLCRSNAAPHFCATSAGPTASKSTTWYWPWRRWPVFSISLDPGSEGCIERVNVVQKLRLESAIRLFLLCNLRFY